MKEIHFDYKEGERLFMDIKMFYKSQVEVSEVINLIIDGYWNNEIEEKVMIDRINRLIKTNLSKVIKDKDFTTVIKQKCGKRRLEIVSNIIDILKN